MLIIFSILGDPTSDNNVFDKILYTPIIINMVRRFEGQTVNNIADDKLESILAALLEKEPSIRWDVNQLIDYLNISTNN